MFFFPPAWVHWVYPRILDLRCFSWFWEARISTSRRVSTVRKATVGCRLKGRFRIVGLSFVLEAYLPRIPFSTRFPSSEVHLAASWRPPVALQPASFLACRTTSVRLSPTQLCSCLVLGLCRSIPTDSEQDRC